MADTFLRLYDSKGGFIKQNDDIKGEEGNLNSTFQFVPEVSGTYYISAGDDKIYGGKGDDSLDGGPGDDTLVGGSGADTFVFTPDGMGSDVILDFSHTDGVAITDGTETADGAGDKIDLSAFNIDADDLPGLLSERAGSVILNLEEYGGGRVTIQGGVTLEGLTQGTGADDPHLIHIDANGDLAGVGGTVDGVTGQDGVFIL